MNVIPNWKVSLFYKEFWEPIETEKEEDKERKV